MRHAVTCLKLVTCLAVLSAAPAFCQTTDDEAASNSAAAPVAYVYVQTTNGVNLYDAAANGALTLVNGSPFKTVGEMIGSNGKYFITLGTNWVHSYAIEADGAIGKQVSEINTLDYDVASGETAFLNSAGLDHTGQNLNVMLEYSDSSNDYIAFQSFSISKTGALTFNGSLVFSNNDNVYCWYQQFPSFTANNEFAYAGNNGIDFDCGAVGPLIGFTRKSDGVLQFLNNLRETDPKPWPNYEWVLNSVASDPTNHLAVALYGYDGDTPYEQNTNVQLASYSEDSEGNLVSTNTYEDMPAPLVAPDVIRMSPTGKLLAVAGSGSDPSDFTQPVSGLQIFHFNGAGPITSYSKVLTSANFYQSSLHWDNNNHLYAIGSPKQNVSQLFVYTITPTSISEAPGSPYTIKTGFLDAFPPQNSLVVVPK
jgi:hypothetical protein